jgi:hypothetical protein
MPADTGMTMKITKAYLAAELSDFCRVTEHLARPRDGRNRGRTHGRSKEGKKEQGRWFIRDGGTRYESPRDKSFKRTRGGED